LFHFYFMRSFLNKFSIISFTMGLKCIDEQYFITFRNRIISNYLYSLEIGFIPNLHLADLQMLALFVLFFKWDLYFTGKEVK
jgi:hypothetical protein